MLVNGLGYNALGLKQYTKAAALFQLNIDNYPKSGNVYDSYGDLLAAKRYRQCNCFLQKALAINENADSAKNAGTAGPCFFFPNGR